MNKSNIIDYAISKTLQVHPNYVDEVNRIIFNNCHVINKDNFTRQYGAREKIVSEVGSDDFIAFVVEQLVNIYATGLSIYYNYMTDDNNKNESFNKIFGKFYWEAKNILDQITDYNTNIILYFKANPEKLFKSCNIVANARYANARLGKYELRALIDKNSDIAWKINQTTTEELKKKVFTDIKRQSGVENINIRRSNINKCVKDIINGSQLVNKRNEYNLDGTLFASQDIGNKRKNQEDSVLVMTHPQNKNFKLLIVADGMGGVNLGEYASSYTVKNFVEWFNSVDADLYYHPDMLQTMFNRKITEISNKIYDDKNAGNSKMVAGATFVGAIVTKNETIISSVGDSRAYTIKKNKLNLITDDEAQEWFRIFSVEGHAISKGAIDDYRFVKGNNVILRCIGMRNLGNIQSHRLSNENYDRLLLFSDGITDLLSQDKIAILASDSNIANITSNLVNESLEHDAVRVFGTDNDHVGKVAAGKDNSTAAMYARR